MSWLFGSSSSESKVDNFVSALSDTLNASLTSVASSTNSYTDASQLVDISNIHCTGNLNISNVSQTVKMVVNLDAIVKSISDTGLKNMLSAAITSAIDTNQDIKKQFMSGSTSNVSADSSTVNNINKIANSISTTSLQSMAISAKAAQKIMIHDLQATNCTIKNLNQNTGLDVLAKTLATAVANTAIDNKILIDDRLNDTVKQKSIADGLADLFSLTNIMIIIVVICLVALACFMMGPKAIMNILLWDVKIPFIGI